LGLIAVSDKDVVPANHALKAILNLDGGTCPY
jgi:hypothetical protein